LSAFLGVPPPKHWPTAGNIPHVLSEMLAFGLILGLATAIPVSAETGKSKEAPSKPPMAVAKLKKEDPAKGIPDAVSVKSGSVDPALCVQPGSAATSSANASEPGDGPSRPVSATTTVSPGDPDSGAQSNSDRSNSEMITDKLKLSLEPKADSASEPAPQCGREENGARARDKADSPPN
jgi:hypothetical protein